MTDQRKSVQTIPNSEQMNQNPFQKTTQHELGNLNNKSYDDCNVQKGLVSILMKVIPMATYLVFKLLTNSYIELFITITILLSLDFWTTKNILGPKLVGLRWYSIQTDDNKQKWCFSACSENRILSKINIIFFWIPQVIAILFWLIIFLINLVTLSIFWVGLAIFSTALLILNFALFAQCRGQHQKKFNSITKKFGYQIFEQQSSSNK